MMGPIYVSSSVAVFEFLDSQDLMGFSVVRLSPSG
jgi:hypothetical protein